MQNGKYSSGRFGSLTEDMHAREHRIESLKMKADAKRSLSERIADWITEKFGTMMFLIINAVFFTVWLAINTDLIPGVEPFDPFPFGLLTTIVSLEAIALAIFVLISQNRAAKIADLREEIDLQVDMLMETELTKLISMVNLLLEKHGIDLSEDHELNHMMQQTDMDEIEKTLEDQVMNGEKAPEP